MYDNEEATIERRRVTYDISATQQNMLEIGLPRHLIERLDHGL